MGLHTFLFGKMAFKPRSGAHDHYPYDLDGALRFTRPKTGVDFWPAHDNADNYAKLGLVNGFMVEQDHMIWNAGYGKYPSGPIVSELPLNLNWQITIPGLSKMDSQ